MARWRGDVLVKIQFVLNVPLPTQIRFQDPFKPEMVCIFHRPGLGKRKVGLAANANAL